MFTDTTRPRSLEAHVAGDSPGHDDLGDAMSEILLSVLAEALGAALLGLLMSGLRRAMAAARA
jgi:hypothetical protein